MPSLLFLAVLCVGPTGCAEEDGAEAVTNAEDRGSVGLELYFPATSRAETLHYTFSRLDAVILEGAATVTPGQTAVGLKFSGLFSGDSYSVAVEATGTATSEVCRGEGVGWAVIPGQVTPVRIELACQVE